MAPNISVSKTCLEDETDITTGKPDHVSKILERVEKEGWLDFKTPVIWRNVLLTGSLHLGFVYTILTFAFLQNLKTTIFALLMTIPPEVGVTAGAHRLWTHRSYKAKWPLRVILLIMFYMAGQKTVYDWVRDHRVHHKYTDTDADPHNSRRGFFFSHVGWLMMKKHPQVIEKGRQIDMSDILADPVVVFGDKYFFIFKPLLTIVLPTLIPVLFWNETWSRAILSQVFIRYVVTLNFTWSVNSAAHIWGVKPYDKSIAPTDNPLVAVLSYGEGWHNYHHVFPWDYKAGEFGKNPNVTTWFIDMFAKIGWAYDCKQPSRDLIRMVAKNRGDGTHAVWTEMPEDNQIKVK